MDCVLVHPAASLSPMYWEPPNIWSIQDITNIQLYTNSLSYGGFFDPCKPDCKYDGVNLVKSYQYFLRNMIPSDKVLEILPQTLSNPDRMTQSPRGGLF